jgi:hypothetical protein
VIAAPPSWYPDPMRRHELRYWDGSRWTEHVASARVGGTDPVLAEPRTTPDGAGARRRGVRHLGWVGLLLCVVAITAASVPGVGYARESADDGVRLVGGSQDVHLPAHQRYGIYIDDANNSGYSESCSAVDARGRAIEMKEPSWSIGSDTENLD